MCDGWKITGKSGGVVIGNEMIYSAANYFITPVLHLPFDRLQNNLPPLVAVGPNAEVVLFFGSVRYRPIYIGEVTRRRNAAGVGCQQHVVGYMEEHVADQFHTNDRRFAFCIEPAVWRQLRKQYTVCFFFDGLVETVIHVEDLGKRNIRYHRL